MKKFFTLSLTLFAATSVFAVNPQDAVNLTVGTDVVAPGVKKAVSAKEIKNSVAILPSQLPATSRAEVSSEDVTVQYAYPYGTLFNTVHFNDNGTASFFYPYNAVVPAFSNVTYRNRSYTLASGRPALAKNMNYEWTFGEGENAFTETSSFDLSYEYAAGLLAYPYGSAVPVLSIGDKTYQIGDMVEYTDGTTEFAPTWVVAGGGAYLPEYLMPTYEKNYPAATDFHASLMLYDAGMTGAEKYYNLGAICLGNGRQNSGVNEAWADLIDEEGTISDVQLKALGQIIDNPGCKWSITSAEVSFNGYLLAGGQFDVTFYGLTADNQPDYNNVIGKTTYTADERIGTLASPANLTVSVDFVTVDQYGDELAYKMIDGGMYMLIENLNDNVKVLAPAMGGYPYNISASVINNWNKSAIYGFVDCKVDGVATSYIVSNGYVFGDEEKGNWTIPQTFLIDLVAEYPYLRTDESFDLTEGWIEVESNTNTVSIKTANDFGMYRILCPATKEDVSLSLVNGEAIPEWLTVELIDAVDYYTGLTEQETPRALIIQMELTDGATPSGCEVAVSYKGNSAIFKVNPELSGIESVVDNGVETVASEYYDLQGRKLYAEPMNGLFIRKDLKADGSVKAVKVVK